MPKGLPEARAQARPGGRPSEDQILSLDTFRPKTREIASSSGLTA
jgi:hypothetical protein